jgi:hypothetical protein
MYGVEKSQRILIVTISLLIYLNGQHSILHMLPNFSYALQLKCVTSERRDMQH